MLNVAEQRWVLPWAVVACWMVGFQVERVIDGDSFIARVPIWVALESTERVRVLGVDAPELRDVNGPDAKAFTEAWLAQGPAQLIVCNRDSFGRVLADVVRGTDDLATALITNGYGVPYLKKPKKEKAEEQK